VRGVTAPPLGRFSIMLDSTAAQNYDAQDDVVTHDVPLFFASALDGMAIHQLSLTTIPGADGGVGTGAVIDRVEIWGPDGGVGFM
jgi:molybdopterin biosynthesis enzyme